MIEAGQTAPGFGLPDADQELAHVSEYRDENNVVLYFYPKDDTPGCTIEAKDFTELQDRFLELDTVVLGVSRDSCESHGAFQRKYALNVRLLCDVSGEVCERYGVWQEKERDGERRMGIVRSTFIIDKHGIVRHALYHIEARGHAELVLQLVRELVHAES
jgi:peroxiredoxin Q/BCP